jgi:hypothetical protein
MSFETSGTWVVIQSNFPPHRHCRRVYHASTRASSIYLTLLRTYLWPAGNNGPHRLLALELIKRNRQQMDAADTLQMLPPLVTIQDIRALLIGALRAPRFDTRVMRNLGKARADQVGRQLMKLQARRVKITESRMCVTHHCLKSALIPFLFPDVPSAINAWGIASSWCTLPG